MKFLVRIFDMDNLKSENPLHLLYKDRSDFYNNKKSPAYALYYNYKFLNMNIKYNCEMYRIRKSFSFLHMIKGVISNKILGVKHFVDERNARLYKFLSTEDAKFLMKESYNIIMNSNPIVVFYNNFIRGEIEIDDLTISLLKHMSDKYTNDPIINQGLFSRLTIREIQETRINSYSDFEKIKINDIFYVLQREILLKRKHFIDYQLSKRIFIAMKKRDMKLLTKYLFYFPASLSDKQRRTLKIFFTFINKIVNSECYKNRREVVYNNVFSFLFSIDLINSYEEIKYAGELVFLLSGLNYDCLPKEILNDIK